MGKNKRRSSGGSSFDDDYHRYTRHAEPVLAVEEVDASLPPAEFWARFVSQRRPALLQGHPTDAAWRASSRWTDAYLTSQAGGAEVEVEVRGSEAQGFGRGKKERMAFGEFVRRVAGGDASLYHTTQEAGVEEDGHPAIYAPPLAQLAGDFPLRPALLGRLVPQSVNLWMGCAPTGASSGLHHDFHDNLYILLRGRKRFRLFPPTLAPRMYTHGRLARLHPSGRIVYEEGQGAVLADGSGAGDVAQWRARRGAERELAEAEEAAERGDRDAERRRQAAEARLDAALDAALDGGLRDDFGEDEAAGRGEPGSFSRVDLSLPPAELRRRFPLFPGLSAALECEVEAGQMLYLPAGWFHEVTSTSGGDGSPATHLALNYWAHPPDNLDPSHAAFARPYQQDYWPEVWEGRAAGYEARAVEAQGGGKQPGEAEQRRRPGRPVPARLRRHLLRELALLCPFGYGRRQHLHHHVGMRLREGS